MTVLTHLSSLPHTNRTTESQRPPSLPFLLSGPTSDPTIVKGGCQVCRVRPESKRYRRKPGLYPGQESGHGTN